MTAKTEESHHSTSWEHSVQPVTASGMGQELGGASCAMSRGLMTWWMWRYGIQETPWISPLTLTSLASVLPNFLQVSLCFTTFVFYCTFRDTDSIDEHTHFAGSHMTALSSSPELLLNCKAQKLPLLLIEWHNNYPSTQPANRISPSWHPQPIAYLDIWELICHSQQRPSYFFIIVIPSLWGWFYHSCLVQHWDM